MTRSLDELQDVEQPAWPALEAALSASSIDVAVLPVDRASAEQVLLRLQVTVGSTLGALAVNTGGLVVDRGWLRILGGGGAGLPDIATATGCDARIASPTMLIVGYDVLGGRFAVNGGALDGAPGEVHYWGPDTLEWSPIGAGHTAWVEWALSGGLDEFYADLRWSGWESEVPQVEVGKGLSVYPFPFSKEGRDIGGASRRPVPFPELLSVLDDLALQVSNLPEGSAFNVRVRE